MSRLTLLGRAALTRTRYFDRSSGSVVPVDDLVDDAGRLITLGVVEVATRLAVDSASFDRAAGNLLRASGLSISAQTLRTITENEGKLVVAGQRCEQLEFDFAAINEPFKASECVTDATAGGTPVTRAYLGTDGVMVPMTTDAPEAETSREVGGKAAASSASQGPAPAAPA